MALKQQHEAVRALQDRWPTPLVSATRYASAARAATELAASLSGSPSGSALQWLSPVICKLPSENRTEMEGLETIMDTEPEDLGQITLVDHLLRNVSNDMEGSLNKDEDEEPIEISLDWRIPVPLRAHSTISLFATDHSYPCTVKTMHVRPPCDGFP